MRILIRTSRWAIWSRRLGSFCIPLLVLPILMHRQLTIQSDAFLIALGVASGVAILAILLGLIAYARLWQTGDHGWGRASAGIVLGLVTLSPLIYGAWVFPRYPQVSDVTTSSPGTPALVFVASRTSNRLAAPQTETWFPNAVPRTYQMAPQGVFALVRELVAAQGWSVRQERRPAPNRPGYIAAIDTTLLGWRDQIIVAVSDDMNGTLVRMRSASLADVPGDLGANGRRIENFLTALDEAVSEAVRNATPADPPVPAAPPAN